MERFDQSRRKGCPRRSLFGLEPLETRELLSYSPLGFSLPDLTVTGVVAPTATYGGPLAVEVQIRNIGASSMVEPLHLAQGATSTADAPPSTLGIYISALPRFTRFAELVGTVNVPAVQQNSDVTLDAVVTLPTPHKGLPVAGFPLYVFFRADVTHSIQEVDKYNNTTTRGVPTLIQQALPDLKGVVWDTPQVVQPGDFIRPTIKIANFGTVDSSTQGPVTVQVVVSDTPNFGPASIPIATFTLASVPPLSEAPLAQNGLSGDINTIFDQPNVVTLQSPQVQVPAGQAPFYVGVVIDPANTITNLSDLTGRSRPTRLQPVRRVQLPYRVLPPATQVSSPGTGVFPATPFSTTTATTTPAPILRTTLTRV